MPYLLNLLHYYSFPVLILLFFFIPTIASLIIRPGSSNNDSSSKKTPQKDTESFSKARLKMVELQIKARGIKDPLILNAMNQVKRHLFAPEHLLDLAYNDYPLPIGQGQTISQPYIVALMTELLGLKKNHKVLEIGTGSGYQTAILAQLAEKVYTIETIATLARNAKERLKDLGYSNIRVKIGNGYLGWPEEAPFDSIILTAAPTNIPEILLDQLKENGVMVLPIGAYFQTLYKIKKKKEGISKEKIAPVRFVPMVGSK